MQITKDYFKSEVKKAFEHILRVMLHQKDIDECIEVENGDIQEEEREVAILIQFIGGIEGKIILSCSIKTGLSIAMKLSTYNTKSELNEQEKRDLIKNSLGEIMNILAGKIAYSLQREYGTSRLTTPAMISGKLLLITIYDENSLRCCIRTPFGPIEIILSTVK